MDIEKISALGSEGAPDTSKIERSRLEELNAIATEYCMTLEDLKGLKGEVVRGREGAYLYVKNVYGKVNGILVETGNKADDGNYVGDTKPIWYATLNGVPTNSDDAYFIADRLRHAVEKRDRIDKKAEFDTLDALTDEEKLSELKYEQEVGPLRDAVLGGGYCQSEARYLESKKARRLEEKYREENRRLSEEES
jgi:hypothetical protein